MGTNYYLHKNICSCCGRYDELHIGKSSSGWKFMFHTDETHKDVKDWLKEIEDPNAIIIDEYMRTHPVEEFKKLITAKEIYATQERFCVGHDNFRTDGKYDYMNGEFS